MKRKRRSKRISYALKSFSRNLKKVQGQNLTFEITLFCVPYSTTPGSDSRHLRNLSNKRHTLNWGKNSVQSKKKEHRYLQNKITPFFLLIQRIFVRFSRIRLLLVCLVLYWTPGNKFLSNALTLRKKNNLKAESDGSVNISFCLGLLKRRNVLYKIEFKVYVGYFIEIWIQMCHIFMLFVS